MSFSPHCMLAVYFEETQHAFKVLLRHFISNLQSCMHRN